MEFDKDRKISAGSFDLNKFLYGGYDRDIITTIYGAAGSGKTNFCILASVSQAKKNKKVIFIDTEGGFSVDRFKQICGESWENWLKNIILLKPASFSEQEESFGKLLKEIKNNSDIGLIVVDGMTMLYRLELAEARKKKDENSIDEINSELAKMLRVLAEISRTRNIPVIITNQVYADFMNGDDFRSGKEKEYRMVGGDLLKYWSKCLIELKNEKGRRRVILRKHRSLPEKEMEFVIANQGIRKKGWI